MALTETQIRALKPKDKRYMVYDDNGLYLKIMTSGNKHWRYRYYEGKKELKLSLGEYPFLGLRDAREKRDDLKKGKAHGVDPKVALHPPEALTFKKVATEWYEKNIHGVMSEKYQYKVMSRIERFLFPFIGDTPINEVTATKILTALRVIEDRGMNETTHTVHQISSQILRYAVASGYIEHNPAADLKGALAPVVAKHNASLTDPAKIRDLLRAMAAFVGSHIVKNALWFSAYVFQRPGEIRHMEWTELNFETCEWRIPAEKMKMRRPHIIPLSNQAYAILERMKTFTGHGKYVFPSIRTSDGSRPMSENTITATLRRLGFSGDEMTAHGFRSMASTTLHEQGWHSDAIERQLSHVEGNSVKAAYNYAEYLPERREMMQAWADWLDNLKG
ncbi:integrase [Synergistales bacterium]|nr:integrase [Synergistales bacterium]